jgi:nicotinamidase-related amidase
MLHRMPGERIAHEEVVADEVEERAVALILIDGINGFYDPAGATYFPEVEQTIAPVERLLGAARERRTLVVHAVERHRKVLDDFEWRALPPHYIEGTFDAEIFPRFAPTHPLEIVVPKRRFSAFFSTDLSLLLREQGIRSVVLAGCKTNVSIRATAQDAFANGFHVHIAREATSSNRAHLAEASLEDIDRYMGRVVSLEEAVALL